MQSFKKGVWKNGNSLVGGKGSYKTAFCVCYVLICIVSWIQTVTIWKVRFKKLNSKLNFPPTETEKYFQKQFIRLIKFCRFQDSLHRIPNHLTHCTENCYYNTEGLRLLSWKGLSRWCQNLDFWRIPTSRISKSSSLCLNCTKKKKYICGLCLTPAFTLGT